jgi:DNA-binding GntR family transcriptional regulator
MLQINKSSLATEVVNKLRQMINDGRLEPGAWIDEQGLANAMGVSRTPFREALRLLSAEGLLRLEPHKGCFVNVLTERDLDEIFPLMAMLEGRCAHEAAKRATSNDLEELEQMHEKLKHFASSKKIDQYYLANKDIHEAIQKIAGNKWLSNMVDDLRKKLSLSRHKSLTLEGRIEQSCAEHLSIFAALRARDSEGAEALTKTHLLRQLEALKKLQEIQVSA